MKSLIITALLITTMINAQIVNIPDTYFKAKLLSASPTEQVAQNFSDQWVKIDSNNDGEVQESEAQAVKTLVITELIVFNVTGLNSFSNLETLRLTSCLITTLDVGSLVNLKLLQCNNMQILSNLNTNGATSLTTLYCFSLPALTTLNVSNLSNLTKTRLYQHRNCQPYCFFTSRS
jgi:hypothetical protein